MLKLSQSVAFVQKNRNLLAAGRIWCYNRAVKKEISVRCEYEYVRKQYENDRAQNKCRS